jgi:hypothetical protein
LTPIAAQLAFGNKDSSGNYKCYAFASRTEPIPYHEHSMRAYYSTQKHFRAFILGTPEGWQVSVYDLHKHEWLEKGGKMEESLKTTKVMAQEKVSLLLGKKIPDMKWH